MGFYLFCVVSAEELEQASSISWINLGVYGPGLSGQAQKAPEKIFLLAFGNFGIASCSKGDI